MFTGDALFPQSLKVTAVFTTLTVPLGLCLSLGIALMLNQKIRFLPIGAPSLSPVPRHRRRDRAAMAVHVQ